MTATASSAAFQVIIPGDQPVADPLRLWQAVPGGISFDIPEATGVVWRAELPSDPLAAARALQIQAFRQRRARQALVAVPQRLRRDMIRMRNGSDGTAYGTEMAGPGSALQVLEQARQRAAGELSFSAQDDPEVTGVLQMFHQFIGQMQRITGRLALVESASSGQLLGVTRVAWAGGVGTWWRMRTGVLEAAQHNLVLRSALATRRNWLQFLSLVTSAVVRISIGLMLVPFNPLALWTTWKYVQAILEEYRQLRSPAAHPNV